MNNIKVAIIDDGINEELVYRDLLCYEYLDGKIYPCVNRDINFSHGTKCAKIFETYANHYLLYSIKILNLNREANIYSLKTALEWCVEKHIKLVSLSLGSVTFNDYEILSPIINFMIKNEMLIIAAAHNNDYLSFPASMNGVIGVRCDKKGILAEGEVAYSFNDFCGNNLVVGSLENKFPELGIAKHNSYIAPYILAYALKNVQSGISNYKEMDCYFQNNTDKYSGSCIPTLNAIYGNGRSDSINILCDCGKNLRTDVLELVKCFRKHGYCAIMVEDFSNQIRVCPYDIVQDRTTDILEYCSCLDYVTKANLVFWYWDKDDWIMNLEFDAVLQKYSSGKDKKEFVYHDKFDKEKIFENICQYFS